MTSGRNPFEHFSHAQTNTPLSVSVYAIVSGLLIHYLLLHAGFVGQSLMELVWNVLVHAMPARLLFKLDPAEHGIVGQPDMAAKIGLQAAKSEALGRILGFGHNTLLTPFKRARAMSGLGNAFSITRGDAPPGLGNWDNSCYQNSIIQGFASLPALSDFLDRNIETFGQKGVFETHRALRDVIARLNDSGNYGRRLWAPEDLKSMSSWQQQDAQEYFSKVVDQMDREIGTAMKGRTGDIGFKKEKVSTGVVSAKGSSRLAALKSALRAHKSRFQNPLEGLLAQRVGCMRCGFSEGLSLIPFNCLTVPLGPAWKQDIRDCLDEYTALEPIEGVECGKCTLLKVQENLQKLQHQIANEPGLQDDGPRASDALKASVEQRLEAVGSALEEEDFSENVLMKKCHVPSRNRVSTTKSRQAVIARAPKSLAIHVNRSIFDEITGAQRKNYADVQFPKSLDLSEWCLGTKRTLEPGTMEEVWEMDPSKSLLNLNDPNAQDTRPVYELKAVIQHYGRHENGHYISYRKYPNRHTLTEESEQEPEEKTPKEQWWRLSDDDVSMVSESEVLDQGGVFMLFYEAEEVPHPAERAISPVTAPATETTSIPLSTVDAADILTLPSEVDDVEEMLSAARFESPRSDTPQTVIDLRLERPVPADSSRQVTINDQPEEIEPEVLDDPLTSSSSSCSSPPSTPRSESPVPSPPSPSQTRTVTPVMRTSSIPDKKTGSHRDYKRNVPSMVSAV